MTRGNKEHFRLEVHLSTNLVLHKPYTERTVAERQYYKHVEFLNDLHRHLPNGMHFVTAFRLWDMDRRCILLATDQHIEGEANV